MGRAGNNAPRKKNPSAKDTAKNTSSPKNIPMPKNTSAAKNTSSASSTPTKKQKQIPPSSSSPIGPDLTEDEGVVVGMSPEAAHKAILAAYQRLQGTLGMEHIISKKMIDDMKDVLTPMLAPTTVTFTNSTVYKAIGSVLTAREKEKDLSQFIPESHCWAAALRCVALPHTGGRGPENSFKKDLKVRGTIMDMIEVVSKILVGTLPSEVLQQAPFRRRTESITYESQNAISAFRFMDGKDGSSSSDDEVRPKAPVRKTKPQMDGNNEKKDVVDKTSSPTNTAARTMPPVSSSSPINPETTENTEHQRLPQLPPALTTGGTPERKGVQQPISRLVTNIGSSPFGSSAFSPFPPRFGATGMNVSSSPPVSSPLASKSYTAVNTSEDTTKPAPTTIIQPKPVQSDNTNQSTPTDTMPNMGGTESSVTSTAEHGWATSNPQGSPSINDGVANPAVVGLEGPLVDNRWAASPAQSVTRDNRQSEYNKRSADDVFGPTDADAIPEKKRPRLPTFGAPTEKRDMDAEFKQICQARRERQPFGVDLQTSSLDSNRNDDTRCTQPSLNVPRQGSALDSTSYTQQTPNVFQQIPAVDHEQQPLTSMLDANHRYDTHQQSPNLSQQRSAMDETHHDDAEGFRDTARREDSGTAQRISAIYRGLDSSESSSEDDRQSVVEEKFIEEKPVPLNDEQRATIFNRLESSIKKHQDDQGIKLDRHKLIIEYWMKEEMDDGRDPLINFDKWLDAKMANKKARRPKSKGSAK